MSLKEKGSDKDLKKKKAKDDESEERVKSKDTVEEKELSKVSKEINEKSNSEVESKSKNEKGTDSEKRKEGTSQTKDLKALTLEESQREIERLMKEVNKLNEMIKGKNKNETAINSIESEVIVSDEKGILSNVNAVKIHNEIKEIEKLTYDNLRSLSNNLGPTMTITPVKFDKPGAFSSPLKIVTLSEIPSLFKVKTIHNESEEVVQKLDVKSTSIQPKYLRSSQEAFKFGITEASFVMESVGLREQITFLPGGSSSVFKDIRGECTGPVNIEASRTDYVFSIFETVFKMYINSQFILMNVPFKTQFDRDSFAGDLVSTNGMLKNQFIDQDTPLLPAAGYGHAARYLLESLKRVFSQPHHNMQIGEVSRDVLSQKKIFRTAGVITDQYMARMNELYLRYLHDRSIDYTSYINQHKNLTLPNISLKVDKPSMFNNSIVPIWRRDECDGCLLVYALDTTRQQKYLLHLSSLLSSVNLLTFASIQEVGELPPRQSLRDPDIQQLLDSALTSVNETEVFRGIALDLSTTWIDTDIVMRSLRTGPLDSIFKVFTIVLWFCYFPSIARDNVPQLMFELFTAMEELAVEETNAYITQIGFSNARGRISMIQVYPKESYISGRINYPILMQAPANRYRLFRHLHNLLVANFGNVQNTGDNYTIQIPRMSDVRQYFQPYHSLAAVSNAPVHGENPNDFGARLKDLKIFIKSLIEEYKRRYRDYSNRSAFGNSTTSVAQLLGYFDAYTPSLLYSIGIRGHAEMYVLRTLGANSPYVIDCQNLGPNEYNYRPQVLFQMDNGDWSAIMMQRHREELSFELPLFMFLSMRGARSIESIMPPDVTTEFRNLLNIQEEGILCGDMIKFVNNIKFGHVGVFNREALGISSVVTAARADKIFVKLAEIASLSQFKDLFSVLINDVSQRIDNRAISFKIVLQPYYSSMYDPDVVQPLRTLYNMELRLGRTLMDDMMVTASPLFIPETSPISLYTNGVAIKYLIESDLDPFTYLDMLIMEEQSDRIILWSPEIVTRRVKDGTRFIDEDVLAIPNLNGERDFYTLSDPMPFCIIVVNSNSGPIAMHDYKVLLRFFTERKIMFFFPELMLIMNRVLVPQYVLEEVSLYEQLEDVLTGMPNRRVTLTFGDTISKPYRLANSSKKLKFIYPIMAINQRQIILKGMNDLVQQPEDLKIGTWMSWAYGGTNGKTIIVRDGELFRNAQGVEVMNAGQERIIDKLELGSVNMNNEMKILTMPEYITMPEVEQDNKRAYVGIYTIP